MTIGQQIRTRRLALGLTQTQLAELVGTSQGKIGDYERGEVEPTITTLLALAKVLGPFTIGENMNSAIEKAIAEGDAHDLFLALLPTALNVTFKGNRMGDDAECVVEGWGSIFWDAQEGVEPGWVVRNYAAGYDDPVNGAELSKALNELLAPQYRL